MHSNMISAGGGSGNKEFNTLSEDRFIKAGAKQASFYKMTVKD